MEKMPTVVESQPSDLSVLTGVSGIEYATKIAKKLTEIVEKQKLYTLIYNKKFVHVEGWTTMGSMLGTYPEIVFCERERPQKLIKGYLVEMERYNKWTKKNETYQKFIKAAMFNSKKMKILKDNNENDEREVEEIKYIAVVEIKTFSGLSLGRATSMVSNLEEGKLEKEEYAIMSQAQTRATGKAYRLKFSWIMSLAGYQPVPNEERGSEDDYSPQEEVTSIKVSELKTVEDPTTKGNGQQEVPTDSKKAIALWEELIIEAKKYEVDIKAILKKFKITDPKISHLKVLIPELQYEIKTKKEGYTPE